MADEQRQIGLRERKKIKTRNTVQRQAVRLFREQGYAETTIEQIAEASEVSPSTLFRYFPTKEALVLEDEFDPMLIELFRKQPAHVSPIQAFRQAMQEGVALVPDDLQQETRERMELIMTIPELSAAYMSEMSKTIGLIAGLIAERQGKDSRDLAVLSYAGAIIGAILGAHVYCTEHPEEDYISPMISALAHVEQELSQ
ncbi:TetR/AcrR family transcriptional regulator [Paenibacillus hodogayensis]|uniref:TetR/AcrR family transcriptional regulator n=1 Tax=Paenibacillus hodogayensis TaxID=279208 RepID=A0ABV5VNU5_9BACL